MSAAQGVSYDLLLVDRPSAETLVDALARVVGLVVQVSVQDSVPAPPPEPEAVVRLAELLGTVVQYSAEGVDPAGYWAAVPGGSVVRVRVTESDDEPPAYTVTAFESPVPQLPGAEVGPLPEVIRSTQVPTPATDALVAELDPRGEAAAESVVNRSRECLLTFAPATPWRTTGRRRRGRCGSASTAA